MKCVGRGAARGACGSLGECGVWRGRRGWGVRMEWGAVWGARRVCGFFGVWRMWRGRMHRGVRMEWGAVLGAWGVWRAFEGCREWMVRRVGARAWGGWVRAEVARRV